MSHKHIAELIKLGQFSKALENCEQLIEQGEHQDSILADKSWCLFCLGEVEQASKVVKELIKKPISNSYIILRISEFYQNTYQYECLIEQAKKYLTNHPGDAAIWQKIMLAYFHLGQYQRAEAVCRKALEINSDTLFLQYSLGTILLHLGRYEEGLPLYEHRVELNQQITGLSDKAFAFPRWRGEKTKGKAVLLWAEQGYGDIIQCLRFIPLLAEQGATVDLVLRPSDGILLDVLKHISGLSHIYLPDKNNKIGFIRQYDFHCPIMSLLNGFAIRYNNIPSVVPYIHPLKTEKNNIKVESSNQLTVGVVWGTQQLVNNNGVHNYLKDQKSIPYQLLPSLLSVDDISFVNLQYPITPKDKKIIQQFAIVDFSEQVSNFNDTANIMDELDIVLSIDTSVVHLAGAMAKPTINILPYISDWRWQQNRDDSPWYPTMRLFRPVWKDDWEGLVDRVVNTLIKAKQHYKKTGEVNIHS